MAAFLQLPVKDAIFECMIGFSLFEAGEKPAIYVNTS